MTVCYFGQYQKDYCRNKNIIKSLKANNIRVLEVQNREIGIKKFCRLFCEHKKVKHQYDVMIVGFPGQIIIPFAKIITNKPVFFDAHVSLYDANVYERNNCKKYSLKALYWYLLDFISCHLADKILLDTQEHVKYFCRTFFLKKKKFIVIYHGGDQEYFYPLEKNKNNSKFIIEFHGFITKLHGIKYLLQAMKKLEGENLELWIIGGGQFYKEMKDLSYNKLKNRNVVFFKKIMDKNKLLTKISYADLGIGILGGTDKVDRVIPNKVYELMLSKIPVLTADSLAIREKFKHGENIFLCRKANCDNIAISIMTLKRNSELRDKIANNAFKLSKKIFNYKNITSALVKEIKNNIKI